jgi:cytochrome oxidase Cu insertion factor (SCO1/SenC/PrrC family)
MSGIIRTQASQACTRLSHTACARGARAMLAVLLCCASPLGALAQHQHHERHDAGETTTRGAPRPGALTKGRPGVVEVGSVRIEIPDTEVLDQDGRRVRFYSDLIKGKVVVMTFFFTSCTLVCPPQGRALAKLKSSLAERFGREVFFISVSKDPETDTPARLKSWGEQFGAGGGWTLVTGEQGVMKRLVWDFTGEGLGQQMHSPILLIGNDRTGVWTEAEGLAAPEEVIREIDKVAGPAEQGRALDVSPSR